MSKILVIIVIVGSIVMAMMSCKSTKTPALDERKVVIQLKKKFTDAYISETYTMYEPQKIKRSNKSLNQYLTTFILDDLRYKGLIKLMREDSNIIDLIEQNTTKENKAVNSSNIMKSQAKPPTR